MKIDKVYYSPEGVVTCSPEGWPEESTYGKWCHDDKENMKKSIAHEAATQKAIASSVPFEDQAAIKAKMWDYNENHDNSPGFYTIEPVEVNLKEQRRYPSAKIGNGHWFDLEPVWADDMPFESRTIARILPKVEKPAPLDRDTPWGGEIPDISASFPQFQKCSFLQDTPTVATDHTVFQPAPVVDKPDEEEIWKHIYIDFRDGEGWKAFSDRMSKVFKIEPLKPVQQPTEWIPVSERVPTNEAEVFVLQNGKIKMDHYCLPVDGWPACWYKTNYVTHWLPISLPEPPKQ